LCPDNFNAYNAYNEPTPLSFCALMKETFPSNPPRTRGRLNKNSQPGAGGPAPPEPAPRRFETMEEKVRRYEIDHGARHRLEEFLQRMGGSAVPSYRLIEGVPERWLRRPAGPGETVPRRIMVMKKWYQSNTIRLAAATILTAAAAWLSGQVDLAGALALALTGLLQLLQRGISLKAEKKQGAPS
jgi:hypothetical protein